MLPPLVNNYVYGVETIDFEVRYKLWVNEQSEIRLQPAAKLWDLSDYDGINNKTKAHACLGGKSWEVPPRAWLAFCIAQEPPNSVKEWLQKGEGVQRWKRGCRGPDGGCRKSRKTASQRRARRGGEIRAESVKSGGMRGLGSSSTANPHLHVELMKTKRLRRNPVWLGAEQKPRENVCSVRQGREGNVVRCNLSFLT